MEHRTILKPNGPNQTARAVALRLPHHPGETAVGLFRLYLDRFLEAGCEDRKTAANLIGQHLRVLEEEGLVIRERPTKKGPGQSDTWTWVGPAPGAIGLQPDEQPPQASELQPAELPQAGALEPADVPGAQEDANAIIPVVPGTDQHGPPALDPLLAPVQAALSVLRHAAQHRSIPDAVKQRLRDIAGTLRDLSGYLAEEANEIGAIIDEETL